MSHEEALNSALKDEMERFKAFYFWLESNMPAIFFEQTSDEKISLIVHSLMGFKVQEYFSEIHLSDSAIALCLDSPAADLQILKRFGHYGIKEYTTYTSKEPLPYSEVSDCLKITSLHFTEAVDEFQDNPALSRLDEVKEQIFHENPSLRTANIDSLIAILHSRFLRTLSVSALSCAIELFLKAQTRDSCQYQLIRKQQWQESGSSSMQLIIAWKNTPKHYFLYRLARVIYRHGLVMKNMDASYIDPYSTQSILIMALDLHGQKGEACWEAADLNDFIEEVVSLKYFGSMDLIEETFVDTSLLTGNAGNFLRTALNFIHQILVHLDPHKYSLENIEEALCRHPELTVKIYHIFEKRLHPDKRDLASCNKVRDELILLIQKLDTGQEENDVIRKNVLFQAINFIDHTLKTNFFRTNKTSHSFRLDPQYLNHVPFERELLFPELPYGIFFFKGMHFLGYHIRFKELARGGLRTVLPEKKEKMVVERNRVFSECYQLAYTQHKKNKDIPEGGAKGIIFLKPYDRLNAETDILVRELERAGFKDHNIEEKTQKFKKDQMTEYLYQTQRSFIKSFLEIINCESDGTLRAERIVDYWKKPEYIYLGPDENLHDVMIEWIAAQSIRHHYRPGGAFISGKPILGINHKQYGVTSLGLNAYMQVMLTYLGIHPQKEVFTVKMTGGPDGDVAGNQIYNLYRYYPKTAKLLALTDVSGTIYDPEGLDLSLLVELFHTAKPISFYPPSALSQGGFLLDQKTKRDLNPFVQQTRVWKNRGNGAKEEWLSGNDANALFRNNVHQVQTDIFIPAGGRPKTLNESNAEEFLDETGAPTAKAIIEGANLYLTPGGRRILEDKGVKIIKDSSANKGGVICSSYEIICGLVLRDEEFLKNKTILVQEILEIIIQKSLEEAHLLLKTHSKTEKSLCELSDAISKKINYFTDELLNYLETVNLPQDSSSSLIKALLAHLPPTLKNQFADRILQDLPDNHKKAIISSHIAAKVVYIKGLEWSPQISEILPLLLEDPQIGG